MTNNIDNIELDNTNTEFNYAVNLVNNTKKLIFLTGKAGTGKTTFLKYINKITNKKTVVLAPTGVAALNAGGQTIHSFFKIPPSVYIPDDFRLRMDIDPNDEDQTTIYDNFKYKKGHINLIIRMELLIIDEVSMIRCDLLDVIDRLLRVFREKLSEPFGGVQVVLIGDIYQLPPIVQKEHWDFLKEYYDTQFFFSSMVLKQNKPVYIELKKIYRQHDITFINLLNNIRINNINQEDLNLLNSRFLPSVYKNENLNYITIATHNRKVDETNQRKLNELETQPKLYEAIIKDDFPDSMLPTEKVLTLKVGAQIMFIKNDSEKKYFNGKITKIKKLEEDKIIVENPNGKDIEIHQYTWNNIKYSWNSKEKRIEETIIGSFSQYPIKLAWSVTVHKCQGLTFDNVIADLSDSFSAGQVYVALSRCTTLEGLVLKSRITKNIIKTDPNVIRFSESEMQLDF